MNFPYEMSIIISSNSIEFYSIPMRSNEWNEIEKLCHRQSSSSRAAYDFRKEDKNFPCMTKLSVLR